MNAPETADCQTERSFVFHLLQQYGAVDGGARRTEDLFTELESNIKPVAAVTRPVRRIHGSSAGLLPNQ